MLEGYQTVSSGDDALLADLSLYYRMYANVRLGVNTGWQWCGLAPVDRCQDRRRRAAHHLDGRPKSLLKANALFEAIHGRRSSTMSGRDLDRRLAELSAWSASNRRLGVKPPYFYPEKFVVTYATSRLVSYSRCGRESG